MGHGSASFRQLTIADAQPMLTRKITSIKVSAIGLNGSGQQCDFDGFRTGRPMSCPDVRQNRAVQWLESATTDAYNAVSITHLLPIGGEDLSGYAGPARLVRAAGDEPFDTTSNGEPVLEHPEPGEVIWRDDAGVTCRRWNWRQCTRITAATTRAVFILDGLGECDLQAAADALVSNLSMLSPKATFERYSPTVISTRSG